MENEVKKKDDELLSIFLVCGVFTAVALIIDFTYGNMHALLRSAWSIPFYILHVFLFLAWIGAISFWKDPAFDVLRKVVVGLAIAVILLIMGHRSGWVSGKMFDQEVNKNKQDTGIKQGILHLDTATKK